MKLITLTIALLLSSACTSYYKPSDTATSVDIEMFTNDYPVVAQVFKNEQCDSFDGGRQLAHIQSNYGDPLTGMFKKIDVNKLTVLTFKKLRGGIQGPGFTCTRSVSFFPRSGESYRALFSIRRKVCQIKLYHKVIDEDEEISYEPEKSLTILNKVCYDGYSN